MVRTYPSLMTVLFAVLCAVPAPGAPPAAPPALSQKLDEIIDGPDYKRASWGVLFVNAKTGEVVYSRNPDAMLVPASVTKLFTCAAALIAVGADAKQETAVYATGKTQNGTLRGDLILVASGDLTLGGRTKDGKLVFKNHDHTYANGGLGEHELTDTDPLAGLDDLAKQVKASGIDRIEGEVLIDDRLFAATRSSGSGPDAVSPITVNDNVIDIVVTPGAKEGDPARVTTRPKTAFVSMDAVVATGPEGSAPNLQLFGIGPNQFGVRGTVPLGGKPQLRIYSVDDPALFARTLFIEALRRAGVQAQCAVLRPIHNGFPGPDEYKKLPKVASFTSPPFREVVTVTLKVSHNLYASTMPCLTAVAKGHRTAEAGLREERKILDSLGVDTDGVSFGGGAGGMPVDAVTARATVQLLQGMAKRPEWDAYKAALPLLGVDGTLVGIVPEDSPARGKVAAKTGTLIWYDAANARYLLKSKALAGTMTTKNGTPLHFCILVNNVPLPPGVTSLREAKVLGKMCEVAYEHGP